MNPSPAKPMKRYSRRDPFSKRKRSEIMSRIRSRHTTLDRRMRALLVHARLPFLMYPKLLGSPDFLVGKNVALFCDSSFWHGRNWNDLKAQLLRGSNAEYWISHIERNRKRDRQVTRRLRRMGYTVIRFWDGDILNRPSLCLSKLENAAPTKPLGARVAKRLSCQATS